MKADDHTITTKKIAITKHIPQQYQKKLLLVPYTVAIIPKRQAHAAMQALKAIPSRLDQFPHLKRIKKTQEKEENVFILVCPVESDLEKERLVQVIVQMVVGWGIAEVPQSIPGTRKDYEEWSRYWPINFTVKHSEKDLELLVQCCRGTDGLVVFSQEKILFGMSGPACREGTIDHCPMRLLQDWPQSEAFKGIPLAYYLTKLRLYCKMRVCQMCAMALVHSRLSCIYFDGVNNIQEVAGILCSPQLNHKITIFQLNHKDQE